jgi:hypothetical protein
VTAARMSVPAGRREKKKHKMEQERKQVMRDRKEEGKRVE